MVPEAPAAPVRQTKPAWASLLEPGYGSDPAQVPPNPFGPARSTAGGQGQGGWPSAGDGAQGGGPGLPAAQAGSLLASLAAATAEPSPAARPAPRPGPTSGVPSPLRPTGVASPPRPTPGLAVPPPGQPNRPAPAEPIAGLHARAGSEGAPATSAGPQVRGAHASAVAVAVAGPRPDGNLRVEPVPVVPAQPSDGPRSNDILPAPTKGRFRLRLGR